MLLNKIIKNLMPVCLGLLFIMIGYNDSNSASKFAAIGNMDIETLIERDQAVSLNSHQSKEDGFGNILEVFSESDGNRSQVWAKHYNVVTESWSSHVKIGGSDAVNVNDPHLVTDSFGNGLVVWSQDNGDRSDLWANRFIAAENRWAGAVLIETNTVGDAYDPHLVGLDSGNAFVVWKENNMVIARYWTNHFHAETGQWAKASMVSDQNVMSASLR